ncbi:diaminopimelate decarboxylase [Nocardia cyriacigeorgica]|uniref:Diaminopimelate decarboxylase n=1 Tax=Nocardia cyriacigeorgica TaxID=135487 RepID=A0A5R8PFP9_9NOCA|nr:type II toxin-antitoxin system RelE/ParE family toxin [Nocardia cyriacigeorgica]TLG13507.1 diaminopimelate decarboxylase [Nocardia cyriacigeorgica]
MAWTIRLTKQVFDWIERLDEETYDHYVAARLELEQRGPGVGRPWVDTLRASRHSNMKELRIPGSHARIIFAFDPKRSAIFLIAGDKTNKWKEWYEKNIPIADRIYDEHLEGLD